MEKQVIIDLSDGDFQQGFIQTFVAVKQSEESSEVVCCSLPPIPMISQSYEKWISIYWNLITLNNSRGRIYKESSRAINLRQYIENCDQELHRIEYDLNKWLYDIKERLKSLSSLESQDTVRIIIRTDRVCNEIVKDKLHKLPWHLLSLLPEGHLTESAIAFSASEKNSPPINLFPNTNLYLKRVRILCVLGVERDNIDVESDRRVFRRIPGAYCVFLRQPQLSKLEEYLEMHWDILFFAGHSTTKEYEKDRTGVIEINSRQSIDIKQLRKSLNKAIKNGMKIAIFNSCKGSGLAHQISDLDIAQIIVWREPVPDRIAQDFINHFISEFTNKKLSLYLAIQRARLALQDNEKHWPKVGWLPLVYQNIARDPISWKELRLCPDSAIPLDNNKSNIIDPLIKHLR